MILYRLGANSNKCMNNVWKNESWGPGPHNFDPENGWYNERTIREKNGESEFGKKKSIEMRKLERNGGLGMTKRENERYSISAVMGRHGF